MTEYPRELWQPGDIGFAHSTGIVAKGIRYAERRDGEDAFWNHVFTLSHKDDNGEWVVLQAEKAGVTNTHLLESVAPGGKYEVLSFPDKLADRERYLEFLDAQVSDSYSILSIASCALDMYLPDAICLRRAGTWICSGLVATALLYAGYAPIVTLPDLYTTTPSKIRELLPA